MKLLKNDRSGKSLKYIQVVVAIVVKLVIQWDKLVMQQKLSSNNSKRRNMKEK